MTYDLVLEYTCGCRDVFGPIQADPGDDRVLKSTEVCVPESCQSCTASHRPCPTRQGMTNYVPVEWSEIAGRPSRKSRIANTGTRAWEAPTQGDTPQHDRQRNLPS